MRRLYAHKGTTVKHEESDYAWSIFVDPDNPETHTMAKSIQICGKGRGVMRARWIRGLRKHLGLNQTQFSEKVGVTQSSVSRWEKGAEPEIDAWETLKLIADASSYALLDETETRNSVPVVGYVGASQEVNLFDVSQGPLDYVPVPPFANEHTVAVRVRGDSMAGIADEGWTLYYSERRSEPDPNWIGRLCIVGLKNGSVRVKKIFPGRQPGKYDLYSSNATPLMDQDVQWVAKVEWILP
jgi:transcriptional regulator with XRE-family HTH domain